jgi:hypothetical protein
MRIRLQRVIQLETGSCAVISSLINVVHLNARIMTSIDFGGDAFVEGCAFGVFKSQDSDFCI